MPLLTMRTNVPVDDAVVVPMLKDCSARLAALLGKPEAYVMTLFDKVPMTMAGTDKPACLLEIRSVGKLSPNQTRAVSEGLSVLVSKQLGVPSDRIYLNFTEFSGAMWGFDGGTFG